MTVLAEVFRILKIQCSTSELIF